MKKFVNLIFTCFILIFTLFPSAMAEVEGGNGKIIGIDDGRKYLVASVTMSNDGDLCIGDELNWVVLDETNNHGLSGLYFVKENEESDAALIYVNGKTEEKRRIGVTDADNGATSFGEGFWQVGAWTGALLDGVSVKLGSYYCFYHSSGHGLEILGTTALSSLPSSTKVSTLPDIADKTDDEKAMVEAQIRVMSALNSLSFRYAYRSEEIIPVKDFERFSFSERQKTGGIRFYKNTDTANKSTKLRLYVATTTGEIEVYEATDDVSAGKYASTSTSTVKTTHEITAPELISLSTNQPLSDADTGYIVGVEIFPRIVDDYTKIYKSTTSKATNFEIQINYGEDEYVFSSPAFMPTGASFDNESLTVSSLEQGREYYLSAASITEFVNPDTAKAYTSDENGCIDLSGVSDGLYTLFSKPLYKEYENTISKPILIYLPSDKEAQRLVGVADVENGTAITAGDGVTDWKVGAWSNAGKNNGAEKGLSYDVCASTSIDVYIREGYSVDISGTSLPSSPQSTATESQLDYQKALECFSFKYAYRQSEIIPSMQLGAISYIPYRTQGTVDYGPQIIDSEINTYTKIVVYTLNKRGELRAFSAVSDTPSSPDLSTVSIHTVTADTLFCGDECISDDDGYVVGIEIFPILVNHPEHLTYMSGVPTRFALRFIYGGEDGYSVKSVPDAPDVSVLDGGDAFCIANSDPSLNYEYSTDGENWNAVVTPAKTPMTKASTEYFVRVARDRANTCSMPSSVVSSPVVTSGVSLALNGFSAICVGIDGIDESNTNSVSFYDENGIELDNSDVLWDGELSVFLLKVPPKDYENKFFTYVYSFTDKDGKVTEVSRTTKTASCYLGKANTDITKALDSYFRASKLYFDDTKTVADLDDVLVSELDGYINAIVGEEIPSPSFSTDDPDFTFMGTSLILDGTIKLRHYFNLSVSPDSYTFEVELAGEKIADLSAESEDGLFYADIDCKGISGYNNQYTLTVENKETLKKTQITYGICDFTKNMVVNKTRDEKVYYLSLAIYRLYQAFSNN